MKHYKYVSLKQNPPILHTMKFGQYEGEIFLDFVLLSKILDERFRRGLSKFLG